MKTANEGQRRRMDSQRKRDLKVLKKVANFIKEIASDSKKLVQVIKLVHVSQEVFLKKGHPYVVAK